MFGIGKTTLVQQELTPSSEMKESIPGKQTLPLPPPDFQSRLLEMQWRTGVYSALVGDVADSQANFQVACAEIAGDIKMEHDEVPFLAELALDAVGIVTAHAIGRAIERLSKGAEEIGKISELIVTSDIPGPVISSELQKLAHGVAKTPTAAIAFLADQAVSKGKHIASTLGSTAGVKNAELTWMDATQRAAPSTFRAIRDGAMGLPLSSLLIMRESFHPEEHSPPVYKEAIETQLHRFRASGVAEIGGRGTGVERKVVKIRQTDRLALIERHQAKPIIGKGDQLLGMRPENTKWLGWVDDEYAGVAKDLTNSRFGDIDVIDDFMLPFIDGAPRD
jgi:hypothetical protein